MELNLPALFAALVGGRGRARSLDVYIPTEGTRGIHLCCLHHHSVLCVSHHSVVVLSKLSLTLRKPRGLHCNIALHHAALEHSLRRDARRLRLPSSSRDLPTGRLSGIWYRSSCGSCLHYWICAWRELFHLWYRATFAESLDAVGQPLFPIALNVAADILPRK